MDTNGRRQRHPHDAQSAGCHWLRQCSFVTGSTVSPIVAMTRLIRGRFSPTALGVPTVANESPAWPICLNSEWH